MNKVNCETIRQAAMALADGETASLTDGQVREHLAGCPGCRRAVEEQHSLSRVLDVQRRQVPVVDLWPGIQRRLPAPGTRAASFRTALLFVGLVLLLVAVRGVVLGTARPGEWVARVVGLLLVFGWFLLARDNPFAIRSQFSNANESKP